MGCPQSVGKIWSCNCCCLSLHQRRVTLNCMRCLTSPSLFEASAVGGPSLHRLHLQCSCSLCTCLWSLCWRRCLRCAQGHPTTVFCKISVRRSKNCLEFSITRGRLTISRWPFHSCTIFKVYLSLIFRIPIPRFSTLRAVVSPGRTLRFDIVPQPDLLSSLSRIPFSSTILYLMSRFWGIHLLSSGQIPYPLNKFCVTPNPSPYFGSNRGSRDTPSRPCLSMVANIFWDFSSPTPPPPQPPLVPLASKLLELQNG